MRVIQGIQIIQLIHDRGLLCMEVIALISQKGGVAKTTSAANIGAGLSQRGKRVLLIDLDAQGSLTSIVGGSAEGLTVLDVLQRKCKAEQAIQRAAQVDLIAASESLAAEGILTATGKEYRLREALQGLREAYDYILLDCPPSLGILSINALTAADSAIILAQADTLSLQAIRQLSGTIDVVRRYTNQSLGIRGILIARYSGRAVLSREAAEMIEAQAEAMGTKVFATRIRECIAIKEAQAMRLDIFSYAGKSNGAKDYTAVIAEILEG